MAQDGAIVPSVPVASRRWRRRSLAARLRWYELLPEVVLVGGLAFFAVDEPDAASSAFASTRAVTIMLATAIVWATARLVSQFVVPRPWLRAAVFGVGAAAVLSVVVLPAYDDTTVIEAFPGVPGPAVSPFVPATDATATTAPTTVPVAPTAPIGTTATTAAPSTVAPTTTVAPGPVLLASAEITGIDHRATGLAAFYLAPDGSQVVGLEGIDIQPGPDYDVYLVRGVDRDRTDDGIRLDDLRGNIGTQFYVVPPDVDLTAGSWTVLVWCQTFGVPVANATPVSP